eukprot:CAMPEP_0116109908 /NCGR_PEP_ID=MMETSP0327-20121206/17594_1 /TAXON_ID=44447 /ORGANISM="Pseudo-nitzschia delicatissima, Strain B596" /LENGTH=62 /DNA_ID=CAMNT_0003602967 /DNA_START=58 /DNA_END=243 /DNA_ORIENTATION=+
MVDSTTRTRSRLLAFLASAALATTSTAFVPQHLPTQQTRNTRLEASPLDAIAETILTQGKEL